MVEAGHLERIRSILLRRGEPVEVRVIDSVEPEPSVDTVERGAELMRGFRDRVGIPPPPSSKPGSTRRQAYYGEPA